MAKIRYRNDSSASASAKDKGKKDPKPSKWYIVPLVVVGLLLIWFTRSRDGMENFEGQGAGSGTKMLRNNGTSDSLNSEGTDDPATDGSKNADSGDLLPYFVFNTISFIMIERRGFV